MKKLIESLENLCEGDLDILSDIHLLSEGKHDDDDDDDDDHDHHDSKGDDDGGWLLSDMCVCPCGLLSDLCVFPYGVLISLGA